MSEGFGKHYGSMYEGSMIKSGALVFAVMGYVIAKGRPVGELGSQVMVVELNPELLGFILGEEVKDVARAIEFLCSADPKSRSKEEGGRRLVKQGEFEYRVVNGMKYREGRDPQKRKEQVRLAQERYREKKKNKGLPLPGERAYLAAEKRGDGDGSQKVVEEHLPAATLQVEPFEDGKALRGKWDWKQGPNPANERLASEGGAGSQGGLP